MPDRPILGIPPVPAPSSAKPTTYPAMLRSFSGESVPLRPPPRSPPGTLCTNPCEAIIDYRAAEPPATHSAPAARPPPSLRARSRIPRSHSTLRKSATARNIPPKKTSTLSPPPLSAFPPALVPRMLRPPSLPAPAPSGGNYERTPTAPRYKDLVPHYRCEVSHYVPRPAAKHPAELRPSLPIKNLHLPAPPPALVLHPPTHYILRHRSITTILRRLDPQHHTKTSAALRATSYAQDTFVVSIKVYHRKLIHPRTISLELTYSLATSPTRYALHYRNLLPAQFTAYLPVPQHTPHYPRTPRTAQTTHPSTG